MPRHQYRTPGRYFAVCNKADFSGQYIAFFEMKDVSGQCDALTYFLKYVSLTACVEAVYPVSIYEEALLENLVIVG